jgi:hypothetical protein
MTGRIPFCLLTLLAVLAWTPAQAQELQGPPMGYGEQSFGPQANQPSGGSYFGIPLNYQRTPVDGPPGSPPSTVYRELPDDIGLADNDTPLGTILKETFRHAWFRSEYLAWSINGPGNVVAGEQTASGVRQTYFGYPASVINTLALSPLTNQANTGISPGMNFTQTVNGVAGSTQSPGLGDFNFQNLNGFRETFGLPLPVGTIELSGFVLASASVTSDPASIFVPGSLIQGAPANTLNSSGTVVVTDPFWTTGNPALVPGLLRNADGTYTGVTANGLPPENPHPTTFFSQAALLNGKLSDSTFINYDVSYQAKMTSSVWGTEANFVMDSPDPNGMIQLKPSVGFRYLNYRNGFYQSGQYFSDSTRVNIVSREIDSSANNNLYGPQASLRAETGYSRFLIGFEPKVMLGLNTWQSNLSASNVFTPNTSQANVLLNGTTFAPLVDLKVYGNVAITKNLSAYGSYNYMWTSAFVHSSTDIVYNNPNLYLNKQYSTGMIQGLSLGLELRF